MSDKVQFLRPITVEGVTHAAGAIVPCREILSGCLQSLLYTGAVTNYVEPPAAAPAAPAPPPDPPKYDPPKPKPEPKSKEK